ITSPNQDWVPAPPSLSGPIKTYTDGSWGLHEYSRWPQLLTRNMWHVACIPRCEHGNALPSVLWLQLLADRHWVEDSSSGLIGMGSLTPTLRDQLHTAAYSIISRVTSIAGVPDHRLAFLRELCLVLQQCVERMKRLPSPAAVAIALAAHVQRLCLELLGLETYLKIVLPRLECGADYSVGPLPILGLFVDDARQAAKFVRAGVPTWLIQPFNPSLKIWRVVPLSFPDTLKHSRSACDSVTVEAMAQISNADENWLASMVFAISRQLCDAPYPILRSDYSSHGPRPDPARVMRSRALCLDPPDRLAPPRSPRVTRVPPPSAPVRRAEPRVRSARPRVSSSSEWRHPSREYNPSPFYSLPRPWALALQACGRLKPPQHSVRYFYPPPFLLDTDDKIPRYIHNLVRIREFCRLRLLDSSIQGTPLTIAEWRAALWGDYDQKHDPSGRPQGGDQTRAERKHEQKAAIGHLFGNGACLPSYSASANPTFCGSPVTAERAARDFEVRMLLLWEAHEVNWRCELMALDHAMMPRDNWPVVRRWAREAELSSVWGRPTAMLSVVPDMPVETSSFCWAESTDVGWRECRERLHALVKVLARWDGCSSYLRDVARQPPLWTAEEYDFIQHETTKFYTTTFVNRFHRLPVVPIAFAHGP
ncbi:hypothetical protein C8Q76DRAFT_624266, partial [Earliella scabrosa]